MRCFKMTSSLDLLPGTSALIVSHVQKNKPGHLNYLCSPTGEARLHLCWKWDHEVREFMKEQREWCKNNAMSLLIQQQPCNARERKQQTQTEDCLSRAAPRSAVNDCWQMGSMTGPDWARCIGNRKTQQAAF